MVDRFSSLDGWRAVAIGLVLVSHHWAAVADAPLLGWIYGHGDLGVRIFFVVSGFLITRLLLDEHERTGRIDLVGFYLRRAFRIFPAYYLYLAVLGLLAGISVYEDAASSWLGALTYTRNIIGVGQSATAHLWSLAVEEQFYLFWPAGLVFLVASGWFSSARAVLVGAVLVAITVKWIDCTNDGFVCTRLLGSKSGLRYADSLAVGCLGAMNFQKIQSAIASVGVRARAWLTYATLGALVAAMTMSGAFGPLNHALQAIVILSAIAITMQVRQTWAYLFLNSRLVTYLGAISYSLYLWHMLFLPHYMGHKFNLPAIANLWWVYALAMAAVSYHLVEQPIRSWGRRRLAVRAPSTRLAVARRISSTGL